MRPGPSMTLEVPNMGQAGATGFMGSSSQSSPTASHIVTKLIKWPPPRRQTRQVEAGFQRELVESRSGGKERRKGDGTSLATRHQKT